MSQRYERATLLDWIRLTGMCLLAAGLIWLESTLKWAVYGNAISDLIAKVLP